MYVCIGYVWPSARGNNVIGHARVVGYVADVTDATRFEMYHVAILLLCMYFLLTYRLFQCFQGSP